MASTASVLFFLSCFLPSFCSLFSLSFAIAFYNHYFFHTLSSSPTLALSLSLTLTLSALSSQIIQYVTSVVCGLGPRLERQGACYFSNFVSHFQLSNRESATQLFQELIQSTLISRKRREKLQAAYKDFQEHNEEQLWAKHSLELNTVRTARRLARAAQDTAVEEAEAAYAHRRNEVAASVFADQHAESSGTGDFPTPSLPSIEFNTGAGPKVAATGESDNSNDAYDDDISPDNEYDAQNPNVEPSPPTKKRKSSKQFTDNRRKSL
ncbi:MAG: hypothetical protein J3R72DRAFT_88048 [Linnemannia gamsii]|nr:MAG: hypothetical protein J3R72DRAFT_88048 [Linnemannia gamsii]